MHIARDTALPSAFCWTRMGTEAGESLERILVRKEIERTACEGVFYWGIGSAVAAALAALIDRVEAPEVLFSPIKSAPRRVDAAPSHVVRWRAGWGLSGEWLELSPRAHVTSRVDPLRPTAARYALVCASEGPVELRDHGELRFDELHNLRSGARVGASQVTAIVLRTTSAGTDAQARRYRVALRAALVWPYLLRLTDPTPVTPYVQPGRASRVPLGGLSSRGVDARTTP